MEESAAQSATSAAQLQSLSAESTGALSELADATVDLLGDNAAVGRPFATFTGRPQGVVGALRGLLVAAVGVADLAVDRTNDILASMDDDSADLGISVEALRSQLAKLVERGQAAIDGTRR